MFVGKDQVVYLFSMKSNPDKIYALYNTEFHKVRFNLTQPINSFDISIDLKTMVCLSNYGFVYIFNFKDTLRALRKSEVEFQQLPIFWINDVIAKEVDYNPLDKSFEVEPPQSPAKAPQTNRNTLSDKSTHKEYREFEVIPHIELPFDYERDPDRPIVTIPQELEPADREQLYRMFYLLKKHLNS